MLDHSNTKNRPKTAKPLKTGLKTTKTQKYNKNNTYTNSIKNNMQTIKNVDITEKYPRPKIRPLKSAP